ncbi:MAG: SDR family NAD(P)-dependent oxidoreductase [Hyphomicrobiales bacterium]|nr:SDR family NAD(P)-dependent oxidoreductase [Hyphomicrobiales bacterium]MDE2017373.1 SDR family NAD(P)-dependent oxidoreductase [Hyphomicrobiales bacterium]
MTEMARRIALVAGASRGIGRAVAVELARRGAHVVALARTKGELESLDDDAQAAGATVPPTLVEGDLRDAKLFDALAASLAARFGRVDALVVNAAVLGPITPLVDVEDGQWDQVMSLNVTAAWRLVRAMDPLLRRSAAGRAVFVTSSVGQRPRAYWGPYAISKAALDALARTYAAETVNASPVRVMLANPGPLRTQMRAAAMPGEDPLSLKTPEDFAPRLADLCEAASTDTGRLYDFPTGKTLDFHPPG